MYKLLTRVGILFVLCGMVSHTSAQVQISDSLKNSLLNLKRVNAPDSVYLATLNDYIYSLQYSNPDTALILGEQSRSKSKEIGFDKGYLEASRNIGIVHYLKGNFVQALEYFLDALRVAERIQDKKGIGRIYNNIGLIYYGEGKYDLALESQQKSLAIKEEIKDRAGIATSLNNMANIYKNLNNYSESLRYHKLSLKVKEELGDKRSIAASLNNIGWLYLKQKKYGEALPYFEQAEPFAHVVQDKILISDVLQGLAECFLDQKKYYKASQNANAALKIASSINLKDQLRDCNETLSRIFKAQGNYKSALQYYELFKLYSDSINSIAIEKQTASLTAKYEFEKREAFLTAEQTKLNAQHEKSNLQLKWIIFSVLLGLIFVSVIAFMVYRSKNKLALAYKRLEEATNEINDKSEALRDINIVLLKQKTEVIEQRDLVTLQNTKLQEISATLEQHKQNLEAEVERRTLELQEYALQMEQFAFFTAHDLRAPVATILGLANLLSYHSSSLEDKQVIFEKLVLTTRKLDCVVKQLNNSIEKRSANEETDIKVTA